MFPSVRMTLHIYNIILSTSRSNYIEHLFNVLDQLGANLIQVANNYWHSYLLKSSAPEYLSWTKRHSKVGSSRPPCLYLVLTLTYPYLILLPRGINQEKENVFATKALLHHHQLQSALCSGMIHSAQDNSITGVDSCYCNSSCSLLFVPHHATSLLLLLPHSKSRRPLYNKQIQNDSATSDHI